jgi:type IV secretion system protein TrbL
LAPDPGILTAILSAFMGVFSRGTGLLTGDAERFLFLLAGLELVGAALFWALQGEELIVPFIRKILVIGVFAWFVLHWPTFLNAVRDGFLDAGFKAGGGTSSIGQLNDPSAIVSRGLAVVAPIAAKVEALSPWSVGDLFLYGWAMLFTLLAFFILGIQVFLTYLEFYLLATLALVLVPFGVLRWTAFMAEKSFGLVFSFGVKLMVLAFIVSAAEPVLAALTLPANPNFNQVLSVLVGAMAITFLAWHAPGVAAGLVAGGPSLSASGFGRGAATMAFGATAASREIFRSAAAVRTYTLATVRESAALGHAAAAGARGPGNPVAGAAKGALGHIGSAATARLRLAWLEGQALAWRPGDAARTGTAKAK